MKMYNNIWKPSTWLKILWSISLVFCVTGCWIKTIPTPHYSQQYSVYSGAACVKMVLESDPVGLGPYSLSHIFSKIYPNNSCPQWFSDPKGIKKALNYFTNSNPYFLVDLSTSQKLSNHRLADTIDYYGVPAIALISGGEHWVVVRGVVTSSQPSAGPYSIHGFIVKDPATGPNSLGANRYIEINTWNSLFTKRYWCNAPGGSKYITVVDPDRPSMPTISYPPILERRSFVFEAAEIQKIAAEFFAKNLANNSFSEYDSKNAFQKLSTTTVGDPKLVTRLDRENNAYYTVPLLAEEGRDRSMVQGVLLFDAYSGQFKEMSVVEKPVSYELVDNRKYVLMRFSEHLGMHIEEMEASITFELVWMPSIESRSPFHPIWIAKEKKRHLDNPVVLGYMDQNGEIRKSLTPIEVQIDRDGF